jgi:hypothetical protein
MQGSFFIVKAGYLKGRGLKALSSEGLVGAVAERTLLGMLAGAEVDHAGGFGLVRDRREGAALVGAIAERLGFAVAAGAPVVGLAGFDEDGERGFLRDVRRGHEELGVGRRE